MQAIEFEREALHQLPLLLANLFAEPAEENSHLKQHADFDAQLTAHGRQWLIEVKSSSSPAIVANTAKQLTQLQRSENQDGVCLLVVPHMTPSGSKTAANYSLNWLDLSGNAYIRDSDLYVRVEGRPNKFIRPGRPSSAFAPKAARIARTLLLDPDQWWQQKELANSTKLNDGYVSRIVRRLTDNGLLEREKSKLRPNNPNLLLDAWTDDYQFERHDVLVGHMSGTGEDLATTLHQKLKQSGVSHAFTGLLSAWALGHHARFRLCSVYVEGDPREAADAISLRRNAKGANVQLIGPDDQGVFLGQRQVGGYPCVSPVQTYLDLINLPERANEAAQQLRDDGMLWPANER